MSRFPTQLVAAEDVVNAVETYADRLHDLLRRRGLDVADATAVVVRSAGELVDVAASDPPSDPLGWWWARALSHANRARRADPQDRRDDPVDAALAQLAEPLQLAVLLRDDYDLPLSSTASALGVGLTLTADRILAGRLELVAAHDQVPVLDLAGHDFAEPLHSPTLLALADGTLAPSETAQARRHGHSCPTCASAVEIAQRARRLAAALPVQSLPDDPRDALLASVRSRSSELLPALDDLLAAHEVADATAAPLLPLPVLLVALAGALVAGALTGAATAPGSNGTQPRGLPGGEVSSTESGEPTGSATATPTAAPTPTDLPSAAASRTTIPSATEKPTTVPPTTRGPVAISASPGSGPSGGKVTVRGVGWIPSTAVTVDYLDTLGRTTSSDIATVRSDGTFTAVVTAADLLPGRHTIRASDGSQTATTTYNAQ